MKTLKEQGIEENTFVVWISDNGPMYAYYPTSGYSLLKGQKGEVYEGGVRVPAMAVWPGMIEPGQKSGDLLHIIDLYTTAARIAGAMEKLSNDRIIELSTALIKLRSFCLVKAMAIAITCITTVANM